MASCSTKRWVSTAPYVILTTTVSSGTSTQATLTWTLQYIADYAASTATARPYTVKVNNAVQKSGTYSINGVTGTKTIASGTVTIDKTHAKQSIPFSVSFDFNLTWSGSYAGTLSASSSVEVSAKTTYTVTYNANGGSSTPSTQTKWHGEALKIAGAITRTGYSFQGWKTTSGTTIAAGGSYTTNAGTTLTAQWKANTYVVSYDANGGTGAPSNQTKTYGTNLVLSSTIPTRDNYTFKGWGTSAGATTVAYAAGATYTTNAAITLYAIWTLDYVKPRISNLNVIRCNSAGEEIEDDTYGKYAKVSFNWECDKTVSRIRIRYKLKTVSTWSTKGVTASGTEGTASSIIGNGTMDPEASYDIHISVSDSSGNNSVDTVLSSIPYTIDLLAGGKGIAFGKTAELENTAEFEFDAKFNGPVYGKALGMDRLPAIPSNSDLNNYMEPGCYAVHSNAVAETITNIPIDRAGRLEVWSATGEGIRNEQWSYIRQRYVPYNSSNATWERDITRNENNVWNYFDWWQSTLTPAAAKKVYSKAAITVALSANSTPGATNTYTQIALNTKVLSTNDERLTAAGGFIKIGAGISHVKVSGQMLIACKTADGNRHVRIQRMRQGTTTSIAWDCENGTSGSNTCYTFTPIIVDAKENDLFSMVFYTPQSADQVAAGSSANGWQTYMTVEEL